LSATKTIRETKKWLDQATEYSLLQQQYIPCEDDHWAGYILRHPEVKKNCDVAFARLQGVDLTLEELEAQDERESHAGPALGELREEDNEPMLQASRQLHLASQDMGKGSHSFARECALRRENALVCLKICL
jgi:hypothetical protein